MFLRGPRMFLGVPRTFLRFPQGHHPSSLTPQNGFINLSHLGNRQKPRKKNSSFEISSHQHSIQQPVARPTSIHTPPDWKAPSMTAARLAFRLGHHVPSFGEHASIPRQDPNPMARPQQCSSSWAPAGTYRRQPCWLAGWLTCQLVGWPAGQLEGQLLASRLAS